MIGQELTPLMQQYVAIKNQHPDTIVLFQVGDFYELFFEDAKIAAATLGIALTARGKNKGEPIPLCGVPVHALDHYLIKLVKSGFKVAICDQLEPPTPGKVVERGVTRVLTPGTLTDERLLDAKSASYLFSFFPTADAWGLLFGELLTAQLFATVIPASAQRTLESELIRFFPDEIIMPSSQAKTMQAYFKQRGYFTTFVDDKNEDGQNADQWLATTMRGATVQKIYEQPALRSAVNLFYSYVQKNQRVALDQFKGVNFYQPEDFMALDSATQRNLELVHNSADGSKKDTLLSILDRAATPMGSRTIKKWLVRPLLKQETIEQRLDAVQLLVNDAGIQQKIEHILVTIGDLERIVGRIALMRASLHDYTALCQALEHIPTLCSLLKARKRVILIDTIMQTIADFSQLYALLKACLNDDITKPWTIKPGFDQELDRVRELADNAHQKIMDLELAEQQKTGINSLKIRFTQAHGYYIEITKTNLDLVPAHYTRHQTLVGRERYTTQSLRELQHEINSAKSSIDQLEAAVFSRVKQEVVSHISDLRKLSYALAHIDALLGFSKIAYDYNYVRPTFSQTRDIHIEQGKHPVVSTTLGAGFIANDTIMNDQESVWVITGPNMGGKSTYLRQVALIHIMAQIGSFIPAKSAHVPILDRIFTRIGAGDNVAQGKSTFLVEMEETAAICTQATKNSLVILDEVGRGTSTFDGLAIAQAVVEYIALQVNARCLFATHYHELTLLQEQIPGIVSYYAASSKTPQGILFLYKILKGVADGSFGLEVAKLAQLPDPVIARAQHILADLSSTQVVRAYKNSEVSMADLKALKAEIAHLTVQLNKQAEILKTFDRLDYNALSPKQAFDILWAMKERQG